MAIARTITDANARFFTRSELSGYQDAFAAFGTTYVSGMWVPASGEVTLNGSNVSALTDFRTGVGTSADQGTAASQPAWQATSGPSGGPIMEFSSSGDDHLILPAGARPDADSDFSYICLFKSAGSQNQVLVGTASSETNRHQLRVLSTNVVVFNVGPSGTEATPNVDLPVNEWCLAIGSWDDSAERARVRIYYRGNMLADVDTQAGAVYNNAADTFLGRPAGGTVQIAFGMTSKVDLLGSTDVDAKRLIRTVLRFTQDHFIAL